MNRLKDALIATLIAGGVLAATSGLVVASEKGGEGHEEGEYGPAPEMSVEEITTQLREAGARRILEVELEHEDGRAVYEVKYVDAEGRRRETYLDGNDGRTLAPEDDED